MITHDDFETLKKALLSPQDWADSIHRIVSELVQEYEKQERQLQANEQAAYDAIQTLRDQDRCLTEQAEELLTWRETARELGEVDPHGLALGMDELRGEAIWAMQHLITYLPMQLDSEQSKIYDRCTEFLARSKGRTGDV